MNRTLMLLIPIVILVAMGLILLQQMWSGPSEDLQPESLAGSQLPYTDNSAPAPLSSGDLDEAIRREQMNRTQSAPQLPQLDGMPQTQTTAPQTTPPATASGTGTAPVAPVAPGEGDSARSELGKLADASVSGQPQASGGDAADALARQVAGESDQTAPVTQPGQAQSAPPATQAQKPQAPQAQSAPPATTAQPPQDVTPPQDVKPLEQFSMTAISLKAEGSDMILTLRADKRFNYKSFTLTGPDRLVVDLVGQWQGVKVPGMPSNRLISKVREGKFEGVHRIVMDLKAPLAGYETKRVDDQTVTVRLY